VKKTAEAGSGNNLSGLLHPTDLLSDSAAHKNTEYRYHCNMPVVVQVSSPSKITVGWTKKTCPAEENSSFSVTKKVYYRQDMEYLSIPDCCQPALVSIEDLKSYKPLIPR
jgi:hypothetical protein